MVIPRVICFDIGGVIVRICRSWEEGCRAAGVQLRSADLHEAIAPARHELVERYQTGRIDTPAYFRLLRDLHDRAYSAREIEAVHHAWLIEQYAGVQSLVDAIHAAGLVTAALSNTNSAHWSRMNEFPAVISIRHHFVSHRLGLHKPDAAIFQAARRQLGVEPSEIVFFDDLAENVAAARRCGWVAVLVDPAADPASQMTSELRERGVLPAA